MGEDQLRKLNRQLSQLEDLDDATRRRSLHALVGIFQDPLALQALIQDPIATDHLIKNLINCFSDPVERCRDLSLSLIELFIRMCWTEHLSSIGQTIVFASCSRFGNHPFPEPVEELRLRRFLRALVPLGPKLNLNRA